MRPAANEPTTIPLLSCEVATRKFRGRSAVVWIACYHAGASKPADLAITQANDEVRLKIEVPRVGEFSGAVYTSLNREQGTALARDLVQRLGLSFEDLA